MLKDSSVWALFLAGASGAVAFQIFALYGPTYFSEVRIFLVVLLFYLSESIAYLGTPNRLHGRWIPHHDSLHRVHASEARCGADRGQVLFAECSHAGRSTDVLRSGNVYSALACSRSAMARVWAASLRAQG